MKVVEATTILSQRLGFEAVLKQGYVAVITIREVQSRLLPIVPQTPKLFLNNPNLCTFWSTPPQILLFYVGNLGATCLSHDRAAGVWSSDVIR